MQNDHASYVVCLVGSGNGEPFAHFLASSDADRYARTNVNSRGIERAYVFGIGTTGTRAAFSAVLNGQAELVDVAVHGTLQAQDLDGAHKRAWEQARQAGTEAIRSFLGR
jgi:hypothetical protein